jgi:hypothetical protein
MMMSSALFRVTEYTQRQSAIAPVYESLAMCLHDASRFAAALSYARGAYVQVSPDSTSESYGEWWFAGSIWKQADVPLIGGVQ